VHLAAMARAHSGCTVIEQNFLDLDLPAGHFDGVFANATLFHVPAQALPHVLLELHRTLKPRGVLFSSNPRGDGHEGWNGDRYGAFHDWETWCGYMTAAGFMELTHWYRPTGLPPEQQPWLASVWRKPIVSGETPTGQEGWAPDRGLDPCSLPRRSLQCFDLVHDAVHASDERLVGWRLAQIHPGAPVELVGIVGATRLQHREETLARLRAVTALDLFGELRGAGH
jgi:SAM-dependent methyltransferase